MNCNTNILNFGNTFKVNIDIENKSFKLPLLLLFSNRNAIDSGVLGCLEDKFNSLLFI